MRKGSKHTAKSKRQISRTRRGHEVSEETRERMRVARARFLKSKRAKAWRCLWHKHPGEKS